VVLTSYQRIKRREATNFKGGGKEDKPVIMFRREGKKKEEKKKSPNPTIPILISAGKKEEGRQRRPDRRGKEKGKRPSGLLHF